MPKTYFHNIKLQNDSIIEIKPSQDVTLSKKNVNINNLLNRVRVKKNDEIKQNIIFFSLGVLIISLMGIFVTIVK